LAQASIVSIALEPSAANTASALASMSDRVSKLRKLNDFRRRNPHCSASALGSIIADIGQHGAPDGNDTIGSSAETYRKAFRQARDQQIKKDRTPYGPILQTIKVFGKSDDEVQVTIAHPLALLWKATTDSASFRSFFLHRLKKYPPSPEKPWNLVIYTDEVTPGNPMATLNKRKFHAFYWSFLEFGVLALSREECWFCAMTEHSILIAPLSAGLSQLVAAVLTKFFSDGTNLATSGVLLQFGEHSIRLHI